MIINWTNEKKEKVIFIIDKWIKYHEVTCGESVQQCDDPNIDSVNIMADIVDVVMGNEEI